MHPPPSPLKKCDAKRMRISKKTFPDERGNLLLLLLRHPYLVHGSILSARPSLSFTFSKRRSIAGPPALRRAVPPTPMCSAGFSPALALKQRGAPSVPSPKTTRNRKETKFEREKGRTTDKDGSAYR